MEEQVTNPVQEPQTDIFNLSQAELLNIISPRQPDRGFFGNLLNRRVLNPLQERLGMRESLQDQARRQTMAINSYSALRDYADSARAQNARQQLISAGVNPAIANSLSDEAAQDTLLARQTTIQTNEFGDVVALNPLNNTQQILAQAPPDVRNWNYAVRQVQPPLRPPTFAEFLENKRTSEKQPPSAVQTFQFLKEINPEIANLPPSEQQELLFKIIRQDSDTAGAIARAQATARAGGVFLTPGQAKQDELFAAEWSDYTAAGGFTRAKANTDELKEIIKILENPQNAGGITGRSIAIQPAITRPELSRDVIDRVEKIITLDLRQVLGPQFTAEEGERFVARSFNVSLPEEVNAARLRRIRKEMLSLHYAKDKAGKYFIEKGTLKGFNYDPALYEIETAIYLPSDYDSLTNDELQQMIQSGLTSQSPISRAEFDVLLDVATDRGITVD